MRQTTITRKTAETDIALTLVLDGSGEAQIDTGIGFLDHMLTLFARHGRFNLTVTCRGDVHVDAHHTTEDIAIVLGRAFSECLGDRRGIARTAWHDPLDAGRLGHVTAGGAVFTTAMLMDGVIFTPDLDENALREEASRLAFDRAACDLMINQAVEALAQAKQKHDALERYYIDAMDYDHLEEIQQVFLSSLP